MATCPVRALRSCSPHRLDLETRRPARQLEVRALGGHSLRAGCVTQAAINRVSERDIMRQTGHKSTEMLAKYIRIGGIITRNATAGLDI